MEPPKKVVIIPIIVVIYGLYDGINYHLVGGFNHLEKYESQWEGLSHILFGKSKMFETTNQKVI